MPSLVHFQLFISWSFDQIQTFKSNPCGTSPVPWQNSIDLDGFFTCCRLYLGRSYSRTGFWLAYFSSQFLYCSSRYQITYKQSLDLLFGGTSVLLFLYKVALSYMKMRYGQRCYSVVSPLQRRFATHTTFSYLIWMIRWKITYSTRIVLIS